VKVGKLRQFHREQIEIEFVEDTRTIEELIGNIEQEETELPQLDQQTLRSIAANISQNLEEEISTDRYERQVMDELGIESLNPDPIEASDEDNPVSEDILKNEEEIKPPEISNIIRAENTTVSYDLIGRWHRNLYIPAYKCQGGGTVVIRIEVDRSGRVIWFSVVPEVSTSDPCLLAEASQSAMSALFNSDANAAERQRGTITYIFLPQ